jgi:glutamate/tyrosine decarboxylase-like PLP-dependent enzyme
MSSSIHTLEHLLSVGSGTSEALSVDEAESRVVAMLSRVVGYDEQRSRGRTLWGSRAAVLAGLRVAIAKQAPESRRRGVPRNLYCFAAGAGEDAALEAVETTGIGGYHLIRVRTRADGAMDPMDLRDKMLAVVAGGDVPAYVVATAGGEASSAFDDVRELRAVADSITTLYGSRPVHLHVDAARGGLYGVFTGYDFHGNPLGFEPPVLEALAHIRARVQHLHLADSVGLDFRGPGQAAYPAGLFLLRHGEDLRRVALRSLEGASALALHAQLRAFGLEGYRRLLAESLRGERVSGGGPEVEAPGVSVGSEAPGRSGPVEALGPSPGLTPEVMAFAGRGSSRVRPRN